MKEVEITQTFPELPHYLSIFRVVDPEDDEVKVRVHSSIHVNKEIEMPHSWSMEWVLFNPNKFRGEILDFCIKRYGLQKEPTRYR